METGPEDKGLTCRPMLASSWDAAGGTLAQSLPRTQARSRLDLQRVQTIVEFPGSRLSPGAQQLMNMIRFQRQNWIPIGKWHRPVLGNKRSKRLIDLQSSSTSGALHESPSTPFPFPFPFRTRLTSGTVTGDLNASIEKSPQQPGGGNITNPRV
ncbi:Hypothetical predicted protein [Lynx pardinus]|uniref:Uncharacterized protein n=1 Tax=Lynx pardinus TaxID=191816 RepID=A0A485MLX3_LYNPA|nr:Hypothetical predicted protein [Lynx pardinus]